LREISLADAGALRYEMQRCDLIPILQSTIQSLTPQIVAKPLTIHRHLSKKPAWIMADEKRIRQLLVNVLTNSIRYTDKGGQIEVFYTHEDPKKHIIRIEDSAPSVNQEDLAKLFERFYRVESSRNRQSGGSGLGLSICEQIVDAHNGQIRSYQSPLGGLGIEITINEAL
jgi:two-component system sensor histidine kinase BaeS